MFQSPRGDFGFLKVTARLPLPSVRHRFQSPRGDFGFLKNRNDSKWLWGASPFQSPRGDFGFLKTIPNWRAMSNNSVMFQSPRGDFGFLKRVRHTAVQDIAHDHVSIPSRGFWFFEGRISGGLRRLATDTEFQSPRGDFGFLKRNGNDTYPTTRSCFNPLAGILVF